MEEQRPNMYAYIYSKISTESEQEIKRHVKWDTFSKNVDPLGLWKAITETHLLPKATGSKTVLKAAAYKAYGDIKQNPYESLSDFKTRFDLSYQAYQDNGNAAKDDEDVAMDFLESLDKGRYIEFVVEMLNDIEKGSIMEPSNVNEVYNLAFRRLVATTKSGAGAYSASYTTIKIKPK